MTKPLPLSPLVQHLAELRKTLMRAAVSILIGTSITLYFSKELFHFLTLPLEKVLPQNSHFIATTPFESYMVYLKTAFLAGVLLSAPVLFFEIWRFISPALHKHEKKFIIPLALLSAFFFVGGALFGYFVVFPTGFQFVVDILQDTPVLFMPKISDYFSFSSMFLLAFGLTFELPIFILLLGRIGLIQYRHLHKFRKYAVILIFLIAGILTPGPDILSQFMMAVPLLILYELGGLFIFLFGKKKKTEEEERTP
ncbi:MAG: twin-arginine translocase subunit TatC [Deltaproteobacteria bacterium]|nr:twin-arginine translocase subunit TatC [Deltaproteobacteria bacterium]